MAMKEKEIPTEDFTAEPDSSIGSNKKPPIRGRVVGRWRWSGPGSGSPGNPPPPPKKPTLDEGDYALFTGAILFLSLIIFAVVTILKLPIDVDAQDLGNTTQVAGGLSAIALALLAIVHEINPQEFYLKLALGMLSFFFLLSAFCATLALMLWGSQITATSQVSVYVIIALLVVIALFTGGRLRRTKVRASHRVRKLAVYTLTPFLMPIAIMIGILLPNEEGIVIPPGSVLPSLAMLLQLVSMVELAVLLIVFLVLALRGKPIDEREKEVVEIVGRYEARAEAMFIRSERLREKILEILKERHKHSKELLSEKQLRVELRRHKVIEGNALITQVLTELRQDPRMLFARRVDVLNLPTGEAEKITYEYYIAPTIQEIEGAEKFVRMNGLIWVGGSNLENTLVQELGKALQFPPEIIHKYMLPSIQLILQEEYRLYGTVNLKTDAEGTVYIRTTAVNQIEELLFIRRMCFERVRREEELEQAYKALQTARAEAKQRWPDQSEREIGVYHVVSDLMTEVATLEEALKEVSAVGNEARPDEWLRNLGTLPENLVELLPNDFGEKILPR
jgi:hypothetical protein